ncbi:MAG: hypothetical protein ACOC45_03755 [Alkalispirochaetaceae bacterium]
MKEANQFELVRELRDLTMERTKAEIATLPGARKVGESFTGPDWTAEVDELPLVEVGSMTFRRLRLTLRGEKEAVTSAWHELWLKFLRGGA